MICIVIRIETVFQSAWMHTTTGNLCDGSGTV